MPLLDFLSRKMKEIDLKAEREAQKELSREYGLPADASNEEIIAAGIARLRKQQKSYRNNTPMINMHPLTGLETPGRLGHDPMPSRADALPLIIQRSKHKQSSPDMSRIAFVIERWTNDMDFSDPFRYKPEYFGTKEQPIYLQRPPTGYPRLSVYLIGNSNLGITPIAEAYEFDNAYLSSEPGISVVEFSSPAWKGNDILSLTRVIYEKAYAGSKTELRFTELERQAFDLRLDSKNNVIEGKEEIEIFTRYARTRTLEDDVARIARKAKG